MSGIIVYHNGECSKSGGALELLQQHSVPHKVRWYLVDPLSKEELATLLKKLAIPAAQLVRTSEPIYREQYEGENISEDEWLDILTENPTLIQRPVVEKGDSAIIARPPEKVLDFLAL